MDKYYLLRPDGSYSDVGFYEKKPKDRNEGIWKKGEPSGKRYQSPNEVQLIKDKFEALDGQLQLLLAPYAGLIYAYLADKKLDKAKTLVELIPNPFNQGEQPTEYQALEAFREDITGS